MKDLSIQGSCPPDRLAFARTKLARRVAKLQQQKELATSQVAKAMDVLFRTYGKVFSDTLEAANAKLAEMWVSIQTRVTKRILPLPRRADPDSTVLSLVHSVSRFSLYWGFISPRVLLSYCQGYFATNSPGCIHALPP